MKTAWWILVLAVVGAATAAAGLLRHWRDKVRGRLHWHVDGEVIAEVVVELAEETVPTGLPDTGWAEWVDLSERCGEFAAIYIRVRQGIEARRGPGRHRAPEPAPSWVLNTQEIDRRWMQIVLHETAGAR